MAAFRRTWKISQLRDKILNNKDFAQWKPQTARYVALQAIKAQDAKQRTPQPAMETLEAMLQRGESIVLLGEPGAGKTTILQALTYQLAHRAYYHNLWLWSGLLFVAAL